ncbi:MAG: IS110 family transposase [Nocardioidaceae bacterium]|nr:IS110 family transposase [Nocardioidaceae bacterium]
MSWAGQKPSRAGLTRLGKLLALSHVPPRHPGRAATLPRRGPLRATKLHSTLVKRRTTSLARLDALLEISGPHWHAAFGADLGNKTPLRFLAAGYAEPHTVKRFGQARLTRFLYRHSRGTWGAPHADTIIAAATATSQLWQDDLSFPELTEDIAVEARLALAVTEEIKELDERVNALVREIDPDGIIASVPGVGPVIGAVILGRIGDTSRFHLLAAARAFTGLVPTLDASGTTGHHGGLSKRGDALLREALFLAANQARRLDPTLAAKYRRSG